MGGFQSFVPKTVFSGSKVMPLQYQSHGTGSIKKEPGFVKIEEGETEWKLL